MTPQCKLYRTIQILEFTIDELNLFLDTHPDDNTALQYLAYYTKLLEKSRKDYATEYEPLAVRDALNQETSWKWVETPWPWEGVL